MHTHYPGHHQVMEGSYSTIRVLKGGECLKYITWDRLYPQPQAEILETIQCYVNYIAELQCWYRPSWHLASSKSSSSTSSFKIDCSIFLGWHPHIAVIAPGAQSWLMWDVLGGFIFQLRTRARTWAWSVLWSTPQQKKASILMGQGDPQ